MAPLGDGDGAPAPSIEYNDEPQTATTTRNKKADHTTNGRVLACPATGSSLQATSAARTTPLEGRRRRDLPPTTTTAAEDATNNKNKERCPTTSRRAPGVGHAHKGEDPPAMPLRGPLAPWEMGVCAFRGEHSSLHETQFFVLTSVL